MSNQSQIEKLKAKMAKDAERLAKLEAAANKGKSKGRRPSYDGGEGPAPPITSLPVATREIDLGYKPKFIGTYTKRDKYGIRREWATVETKTKHTENGKKWEYQKIRTDSELYKLTFDADGNRLSDKVYPTYNKFMAAYKLPRNYQNRKERTQYFDFTATDFFTMGELIKDFLFKQEKAVKVKTTVAYLLGHIRDQTDVKWEWLNADHDPYDDFFDGYMLYNNVDIYERNTVIQNRADVRAYVEPVQNLTIEDLRIKRPNSKWAFVHYLHVRVHLTLLVQTFGCDVPIPEDIRNSPAIHTMAGKKDSLCAWRCLAVHKFGGRPDCVSKKAKELYEQYYGQKYNKAYKGLEMMKIYEVEDKFEVCISVYSYNENDKTATLERLSVKDYDDEMNLLQIDNHFAYIKDISQFLESFKCSRCQNIYKTNKQLQRHMKTCDAKCRHVFVGGFYQPNKNLFAKMAELEIKTESPFHDYYATFDFEAILEKCETDDNKMLNYTSEHVPVSVSVCSNVPGYTEAKCFIDFEGNIQKFIDEWIDYLIEIAEASEELMMDKFSEQFEQLDSWNDDEEEQKHIRKLKAKLYDFCRCLPVLGFNSSHYDIGAIKRYFFASLQRHVETEEQAFYKPIAPIKQGSDYKSVRTPQLHFLDIKSYLAPCSYDQFLKAYKCEAEKGFFPYEWFDNREKLMHTELPPHEAFYSSLKRSNISKADYEVCQKAWDSLPVDAEGKRYFHQFLKWYNDLDVVPFVEAVGKMVAFYRGKNIDIFQDGISVPGLTLKHLFSTVPEGVQYSLFEEKDKDLFYDMKNSIVGGPSIIFDRHQEVGITQLREGGKICKSVIGFDANALYLWAIMQNQLSGAYERVDGETVMREVVAGTFFGVVKVDIYTPEHLKPYFADFPPIFKNTTIEMEDIGEHMSEHLKNKDAKIGKGKKLISSFFGEGFLTITPLLEWYLKMGLVVKKYHYGIRYTADKSFVKFGEYVSNARRDGDRDPDLAIVAEGAKLEGNSAYGKTATNKEKHTNTLFVGDSKADELIAKHTFKDISLNGNDLWEITQFKSKIKMDLPLQIAFAVYQYAKLKMLDFYYNCIDKFIDRGNFSLCQMDTDSAYYGFGEATFEECIKPEMRDQWEAEKYDWFPRTAQKLKEPVVFDFGKHEGKSVDEVFKSGAEGVAYCEKRLRKNKQHTENRSKVLGRIQELVNQAYDKRTPGLLKEEFKGDGIISLCSKSYICWTASGKTKASTKGVQKANNVVVQQFKDVLESGNSKEFENVGIRSRNGAMATYSQKKTGLTYTYIKRKVLADGKRTAPLDI